MVVLTTAEILYFRPDYQWLLQTYLWQDYDETPRFPRLKGFLDFWESKIEGRLYRVTVANRALDRPVTIRAASHLGSINNG